MNKKFMVYKHTFPNGKVYIGITSKNKPNQRWEGGTGYSKEHQSVMYNAIQKYGWENIQHEILFTNLSKEEAIKKEIELIKEYHSYIHDPLCNGYNMTMGGDGIRGKKFTKELKELMDEIHKEDCKLFVQLGAGFGRVMLMIDMLAGLLDKPFLAKMLKVDRVTASPSELPIWKTV